jgi:hypothetical protein
MSHRAPFCALALAFTLVGSSGCDTQEIAPEKVLVAASGGPDAGFLSVVFPQMDDTFAAEQARAATQKSSKQYRVFMDGELLAYDGGSSGPYPFLVGEGGTSSIRYFAAGPHHFTIAAAGGSPIFDADGDIAAGGTTTLFLFGTIDSLQGKFIDVANSPPAGMEHVTVVNLMRSGQQIEVVSCTNATTCVPVEGGPLAEGASFNDDVPAVGAFGYTSSVDGDGAGYRYRQVPTASVPNPPVIPLTSSSGTPSSANFWGAPVYMSDEGVPQIVF